MALRPKAVHSLQNQKWLEYKTGMFWYPILIFSQVEAAEENNIGLANAIIYEKGRLQWKKMEPPSPLNWK